MIERDKFYFFPVILLGLAGFFIISGIKAYQFNSEIKPQNRQTSYSVAKLKKELLSLEKFPSQPGVPLSETYRSLKELLRHQAKLYNIRYLVKAHKQKDYSLIGDYFNKSEIPGVSKVDLDIVLKSKGDYWQMASILWQMFRYFPLEFNYKISSGFKKTGPLTMAISKDNEAVLECLVTLYGI